MKIANAFSASAPSEQRLLISSGLAVLVVALLFIFLHGVIYVPAQEGLGFDLIEGVQVVQAEPEADKPPEELFNPDNAPPPPPAAPAALAQPNMPAIEIPSMAMAPVDLGSISVPVSLGAGQLKLGSSGSFGGFAGGGRGSGSGGGGGGFGTGQGFSGKPLVPISTARPQMPEWACKQKIKGWVEVVFTVMPNGRVQDVKLVDAEPRGVYEAAAIESISNWIYATSDRAREVKQRVPMDPEDCVYNWQ